MRRLPNVDEVVAHVLAEADSASAEKLAADAPAPKEYTTDVAQSLHKLSSHLRSEAQEVSYDDVLSLGRKILEAS
jgi:hypothetical protein